MVAGNGLQVPPAFAANTASPWSLACLNHVEYGNVPRVAGECVSALDPVVGHQHPSCGKSLEDLGQCFMGQSIEFGQVSGAERTLARVSCQVLRSEETVTRSPSKQHNESRWSGRSDRQTPVATSLSRGAIGPEATGLGRWLLQGLVSRATGAVPLKYTKLVLF